MTNNPLGRLSYIDVLKIVATFAIVVLHVSALYVRMDAQLINPSGALPYALNNYARTALPLFMIISGVLLMRDGYRFKLRQKFHFIFKNYVVWSAIYVLIEQGFRWLAGTPLLSFSELLSAWVQGPYHFWYLQMLLGVYLLMPILSRIRPLQILSYTTLVMFVIIYIYGPVSEHLPAALHTFIDELILMKPATMLFFFLLGASIHRLPLTRNLAISSGVLLLFGIGCRAFQLFSTATYQDASLLEPFDTYSELALAAGFCYLVRYLMRNRESSKTMQYLSGCTLRIYITSALFIFAYQILIQPYWDALVPWPTLSVLVWSVVVFLCGWLTAHLLTRKDRYLRARKERRTS